VVEVVGGRVVVVTAAVVEVVRFVVADAVGFGADEGLPPDEDDSSKPATNAPTISAKATIPKTR
jgi:hypothetical protein